MQLYLASTESRLLHSQTRCYYPESELSDTAVFETALTDLLGPDEGLRFVVERVDVGIDCS